ncbi:hypothetical protein [Thermococcus sp. Bubb.Bath]|uniref:hypothetical protein n=1 Tax=Thermococcus sp. Bubb.Bath TaxID=1638242 RepID=UPI0014391B4E|nr:hypothetical protein [Thermococcus sp. Bubb.Bath]NJF25577.1 hypothetical protein [Thermococcus sp. Bubb.Bath]
MGFKRSFLAGFSLIILSFILVAEVRGIESGLYVLAVNVMFIPLWGTIVLWSKDTGNGSKLRLIILTSLFLFLMLLGAIAGGYHDFEKSTGIMVVFLMLFLMFILPLYWVKRKQKRHGKHLVYPTREVKYFWAYQWIAVGVLVIKSNGPLKIFLSLSPGLVGGYLIINGLIQLKKVSKTDTEE